MAQHNDNRGFFTKNRDILTFVVSMLGTFFWLNSQFTESNKHMTDIELKIASVQSELNVIKTVFIMQNIMPKELAKGDLHD